MGDFIFNVGRGRGVEWYNRVDTNDPANSALIVMVLASAGIESDAVLRDKDTFADVIAGTTNEVTNTNYVRKTLTDADLSAFTPDDTNDVVDLFLPNLTWTAIAAGDNWAKVVVGFDSDTTAGTNANIIPWFAVDFSVVPSGSDITLTWDVLGAYRAA